MNEREVILEAIKKAGEPLNAGKIAELTGLDRKAVDKAMAAMKKEFIAEFLEMRALLKETNRRK